MSREKMYRDFYVGLFLLAFLTPLSFLVTMLAFFAPPKFFVFGLFSSSKLITGALPILAPPSKYRASTLSFTALVLSM